MAGEGLLFFITSLRQLYMSLLCPVLLTATAFDAGGCLGHKEGATAVCSPLFSLLREKSYS